MTIFLDAIGLDSWQRYFDGAPQIARQAAKLAINDTAQRRGLKAARDEMLKQVAWPRGYLNDPTRFGVKQRATEGNLIATIRGQFEGTSLARFTGRTAPIPRGSRARLRVTVQPGRPFTLQRSFLLRLKSGNLGLAIRLRPGEELHHRHLAVKRITDGPLKGVALLYGPSVDQVFRTVASDITPELLDFLSTEFLRQFVRLNG